MKFIKQNLGLLIMVLCFVAALGSSVLLLRAQMVKCDQVRSQLEEKRTERGRLVGSVPFPSQENTQLLRQTLEQQKKLLNEKLVPLRRSEGPLVFEAVDSVKFARELLSVRNAMEDRLRRQLVKFPGMFQFGFERYEKTPPKKENTPMLRKQLRIIDELVRLCAESHYEIKVIRRAEFEDAEPPKPPAGMSPLISTGGKLEIMDFPAYLYASMPFELSVTCDTESLRKFLNMLETSEFIFLPRAIIITNERKDPLVSPKAPGGGAKEGTSSGPVVISKRTPSVNRGALPEAGGEPGWGGEEKINYILGEERLEVVMLIDWLEFRPAQSPKGKKNPSSPPQTVKTPRGA